MKPGNTLFVALTELVGRGEPFRVLWLSWREARPVVQLIFLLRFGVGAVLGWAYRDPGVPWAVVVAAVGWFAATWAIYLINGIADVVEDRENRSVRPIASGRLATGPAWVVVCLLGGVAVVCGAVVSSAQLVLVVLMLGVGWAYSMGPYPLKKSVVGFTTSVIALGMLTYLAGWCAVAGAVRPSAALLLFGVVMSCWMGLVGSTKDLSDERGDRKAGRRTLPVVLGERPARAVMAGLAVLLGIAFLIAVATWYARLLPVAIVVLAGALAVAYIALRPVRDDRALKRRPYRAFMLTQYLAHLTVLSL